MTVRTLITFRVKPGQEAAFEKAYGEGEMLERAAIVPGFLGGDLMKLNGDGSTYAATALWDNAESYKQWQAAYATALDQDKVSAMMETLETFEPGQVYEVLRTAPTNKQ